MTVYIKENSFWAGLASRKLKSKRMAITLGNTIHLRHTSTADFLKNKKWVCHELAHVRQFQRYGQLTFLLMYVWESAKKGYHNNKWEVEARAAERDLSVLDDVTFI